VNNTCDIETYVYVHNTHNTRGTFPRIRMLETGCLLPLRLEAVPEIVLGFRVSGFGVRV